MVAALAAAVLLFPIASASDRARAPLGVTSAWSVNEASEANGASALAASRKDPVLVWTDGGQVISAKEAYLLVDEPFASVQPSVHRALTLLGRIRSSRSDSPLAYQPEGWDVVLLSRRPDLRHALADRFARAGLERALKQGALTATEFDVRWALARARTASAPQDRAALDAFRQTYASFRARHTRSYGLTGSSSSDLTVDVFDVSAAFGRPASAVRLSREDKSPNPRHNAFSGLRDFNILSRPPPQTLTSNVVPATAFTAVHAALVSISSDERVRVAPSPQAWVGVIEPPVKVPTIMLVPPSADAARLDAEVVPWSAISGTSDMSADSITDPSDLLTLPNGDLIISASDIRSARVWRAQQLGGTWRAKTIWHGESGAKQLSISSDGGTVWFDGASPIGRRGALVSYDAKTDATTEYQPRLFQTKEAASTGRELDWRRWELTGSELPAFFDHDYLPSDESPVDRDVFRLIQPAMPAPAAGGSWLFKPSFGALRQSMMNMQGNTLIWPVRWRAHSSLWTEDQVGIAELDADNGRVLRAHAVPQRFGKLNRLDATGAAQWVPLPLGSPQAEWIALGFVLMLRDSGKLPPQLDAGPGTEQRFVGMHVINVKDGRVCMSALLDLPTSCALLPVHRTEGCSRSLPEVPGPVIHRWPRCGMRRPASLRFDWRCRRMCANSARWRSPGMGPICGR